MAARGTSIFKKGEEEHEEVLQPSRDKMWRLRGFYTFPTRRTHRVLEDNAKEGHAWRTQSVSRLR